MSYKYLCAAVVAAAVFTPVQSFACGAAGGHSGHAGHTQSKDASPMQHHGHHAPEKAKSLLDDISICAMYMHMEMDGIRDGTDQLSGLTIANQGYEMVPTMMDMDMAMFGVGYAPMDWLELSVGTQFIRTQMFMIHDPLTAPHNSQHRTGGWGDTTLGGNIRVFDNGTSTIKTSLGLSLPTGSIDEKGVHGDPTIHSPYDMQLGTGTYDLLPGIAWDSRSGKFGYGLKLAGRIHLGENQNDYSWGDKVTGGGYVGYAVRDWMQVTGGVDAEYSGKIDGDDPDVTQDMPTGNADFYGGTIVNTNLGVAFFPNDGHDVSNALTFNVSVPVYQNYNGPQMNREWGMTIGWQTNF